VDWLHERPGVAFEFGDGRGAFSLPGHLDIAPTRNEISIFPADLNGDGFIDLAVQWGRHDFEKGRSRVYFNDGRMHFHNATSEAGLSEIYLNDGQGKFTKLPGAFSGMEAATGPSYVSWGLAVVSDFDNDGIADILWNGRNFLLGLGGTSGGHFVYANKTWGIEHKSAASVDDGLCFGDIDGDGRLDIVGYTGSLDSKRPDPQAGNHRRFRGVARRHSPTMTKRSSSSNSICSLAASISMGIGRSNPLRPGRPRCRWRRQTRPWPTWGRC
jgi:hypothetical protein